MSVKSVKLKTTLRIEGSLLLVMAVSMLPPLLIALAEKEAASLRAFMLVIAGCIVLGVIPFILFGPSQRKIKSRDGFLIVSLSWLVASVVGALPFLLSGAMSSFADAFFESVSGFTTTGSSILTDVEVLPRSILFWRSFTHWLGGMGIIVFITALMPVFGINGQLIANSETTGPTKGKILARFSDQSRQLYKIYIAMTLVQIILLKFSGISWYDCAVHTFGSVGTGGLSIYNDSIAHYNNVYIELVIAVFMLLAAMNFNLYYAALKRGPKEIFRDEEARFFLLVVGVITTLIAVYNWIFDGFEAIGEKFMDSFFQVSSIISTTGYMTDDYDVWPTFSNIMILLLFFIGGCSSSTGGGIKAVRVLVGLKLVRRGVSLKLHPSRIAPVTLSDKELGSDATIRVSNFIFTYLCILLLGTLLLAFDGHDLITNLSAAASSLGNVGPGFNLVGPTMNYSFFSDFAKYTCSVLMIVGRLELFTVLALFSRHYWNPDRVN